MIAIERRRHSQAYFSLIFVFAYIYQQLPSIDVLTDYRPKVPPEFGALKDDFIGEFGEERRDFVRIADVPKHVKDAILCAEDDGFCEHHGIEVMGIASCSNHQCAHRSPRSGRLDHHDTGSPQLLLDD